MAVKKSGDRFKSRRRRLWRKNRHRCQNCGVETILPEDLMRKYGITDGSNLTKLIPMGERDRMATIQHKVNRFDTNRRTPSHNEIRYDLWCCKCNNEDGIRATLIHRVETVRRTFMNGVRTVVIRGDIA